MTDVKAALVEAEWNEGKEGWLIESSLFLGLIFPFQSPVAFDLCASTSFSHSHLSPTSFAHHTLFLSLSTDAAFSALRKRGLAAAAKKASRRAAEGWVSVALSPGAAALAEVNCETDFAARNELLTSLASDAARAALDSGSVSSSGPGDAVEASSVPALASLCSDGAAAAAAVVRENVVVRRVARLPVPPGGNGVVGSYVHSPVAAGASVGRMAGLVALEPLEAAAAGSGKGAGAGAGAGGGDLASLADKLAMHVVAARPLALDRGSLPASLVESERAIAAAQAASSGKPAAIVARIVEGRLGKWYEEVCLLEQRLVMDDSVTVAAAAKKGGARVVGFARLQVGEGLEEAGDSGEDFKSEVEKLAGGAQ